MRMAGRVQDAPCRVLNTGWTCSPLTSQTPNRLGAGAASQALAHRLNH